MYIVFVLFLSDFTYVNKAEQIVTFCFIYIFQSVQTFLKSGLKKIKKTFVCEDCGVNLHTGGAGRSSYPFIAHE